MHKVEDVLGPDRTWHGQRFSDDEIHFVCPWHGYEYDLKTGECAADRSLKLKSFRRGQARGGHLCRRQTDAIATKPSDAEIQAMLAQGRAALCRARDGNRDRAAGLSGRRADDRHRSDGHGHRHAQGGEPAGVRARHVAGLVGTILNCPWHCSRPTKTGRHHGSSAQRFPQHGGRGIRHHQAARARGASRRPSAATRISRSSTSTRITTKANRSAKSSNTWTIRCCSSLRAARGRPAPKASACCRAASAIRTWAGASCATRCAAWRRRKPACSATSR